MKYFLIFLILCISQISPVLAVGDLRVKETLIDSSKNTAKWVSSNGTIKIEANRNNHIIPWDKQLGNTILFITAPIGKEDIHIITSCKHTEEILYKEKIPESFLYTILISFDQSCRNPDIQIGDTDSIFTDTKFSLPFESLWDIRNSLIESEDTYLQEIIWIKTPPLQEEEESTSMIERVRYMQTLYRNSYIFIRNDIAKEILHNRESIKYISPVLGYTLPNSSRLMPWASRPYRKNTTDGIHHGWDIMAPYGTPVQAIGDWEIIRIINDWTWNDFNKLKKNDISENDKLLNLDIFRGNQIWLKTLDGNITFYSHLSKISPNIGIGKHVKQWTYLGNIGKSGIPDKNYRDIHLHFEIQKSPLNKSFYSYLEIMWWEYIGYRLNYSQIKEKERDLFN